MSQFTVLSLGWGVQSFALAAMVALEELPPIDMAIHADTHHEYTATYEFAKRWTPWLEKNRVKVITVSADNTNIVKNDNQTPIPAFTLSETGKKGQLRRQCTDRWKIRPVRKFLRSILGRSRDVRVTQWLGISIDEVTRAKDSDVQWITNDFPLLDRRMSRLDCIQWLTDHNLEVPPKSSCIFCPYHNNTAWEALKDTYPVDYERAVLADEQVRETRPPYPLFVHPSRQPLSQFTTAADYGAEQLNMWDNECEGVCFL